MQVTALRSIACCVTVLALGAHVGNRYYRARLTCGTAVALFASDGQCTLTIIDEDMFGPRKLGWPGLRVWLDSGYAVDWFCWDIMYGNTSAIIIFPVWLLGVPWALVAIGSTFYLRYCRRRTRLGRCRRCGYNLTGNVSGVCPECGARVPERVRQTRHAEEANA